LVSAGEPFRVTELSTALLISPPAQTAAGAMAAPNVTATPFAPVVPIVSTCTFPVVVTQATFFPSFESDGELLIGSLLVTVGHEALMYDHATDGPFALHKPPTEPCVVYS